jgi:hypothetical protein
VGKCYARAHPYIATGATGERGSLKYFARVFGTEFPGSDCLDLSKGEFISSATVQYIPDGPLPPQAQGSFGTFGGLQSFGGINLICPTTQDFFCGGVPCTGPHMPGNFPDFWFRIGCDSEFQFFDSTIQFNRAVSPIFVCRVWCRLFVLITSPGGVVDGLLIEREGPTDVLNLTGQTSPVDWPGFRMTVLGPGPIPPLPSVTARISWNVGT